MIYAQVTERGKLKTYESAVSDSIKFETIKFEFPRQWMGLTKTAVFRNSNQTLSVVFDEGNSLCISDDECYIPHEMLTGEEFTVSVFGENSDTRATTEPTTIKIRKSGYGEGDTPAEPTPTEYQQLINIVNEIKQLANNAVQVAESVRTEADNGEFDGKKGDTGDQGDKGDKGDPFIYSDFTEEQLSLLKGAEGDKGDKGDKGDTGPRGPQGLQGIKGDKGSTGDTGPQGPIGQTGPQGVQGIKGEKGDNGDKGDKGDAFTYEDFTNEQLALLKGEKGDKGDTGDVTALQMNSVCANALKGHISGNEIIRITDLSPHEHNLNINISSQNNANDNPVVLKKHNKNLLEFPYFQGTHTDNGINFTVNEDGSITADGEVNANSAFGEFVLSSNSYWPSDVKFTISGCPEDGSKTSYFIVTKSGYADIGSGVSVYANELSRVAIRILKGTTVSNLVFKPQIELGDKKSSYELYSEPETYYIQTMGNVFEIEGNSDVTLMTNVSDAIIEAEYNRDLNKVIEKLEQSLL